MIPGKSVFEPDEYYESLERVDFAELKARGYKLVMLDLDNTLSVHGAHAADDYARNCIRKVHSSGLECWIVTNARKKRAAEYAGSLDLPFIAMAGKPSPGSILRACQNNGIGPDRAVMIGDQMITDIAGANRAGCLSVLVKPRFKEEPLNVRFKRLLEKPLYRRFNLNNTKSGPGKD